MPQISIGDLSQNFQLRRQSTQLSRDLTRLAQELTTGRKQDIRSVLRGDTAGLAAIELGMKRVASFELAIKDATLEVTARQSSIQTIRLATQEQLGALLIDETLSDPTLSRIAARDAAATFDQIVGTLNGVAANRSLFAGTATDGAALTDTDTMLLAIEAEITLAGAVTAADVETVVETWFAPGGGFDTIGYIGGADTLTGPRVSESEVLGDATRADDLRIRETLAGFAMAALVDRGQFGALDEEASTFLRRAGERMLNAERGLADLQGQIGLDEARLERAETEGATERIALETARQALIGADPYETAGQLQAIDAQIRSLYTVTARLSQLSLTAYLR